MVGRAMVEFRSLGSVFMPHSPPPRLGVSYGSVPFAAPDPSLGGWNQQRSLFLAYVIVQVFLWSLVLALPQPERGYASTVAGALGIVTFVVCVVRLRPDRLFGWWLIVASSLALLAAGILT